MLGLSWFILFHPDVKFLPTYIRLHSCKDASMHICIYIHTVYIYIYIYNNNNTVYIIYIYIYTYAYMYTDTMHICTHIRAIYVNIGRYENQEVRIEYRKSNAINLRPGRCISWPVWQLLWMNGWSPKSGSPKWGLESFNHQNIMFFNHTKFGFIFML